MSRNTKIDIIKGISIILVVLVHAGLPKTKFIQLFVMAAFFIASGYFFKDKSTSNVNALFYSIKKRLAKIWLPFVVWNTIFTLLNNFFIKVNIYTSDVIIKEYLDPDLADIHSYIGIKDMAINIIKGFFLAGHTGMGGTFWFLRALFYISVLYLLINFVLFKVLKEVSFILIAQAIISSVFLFIGFYMSLIDFNSLGLDLMLSYYSLYYLGVLLGRITPKFESNLTILTSIIIAVICAIILTISTNFGEVHASANHYKSPWFLIINSLLGWFMLYSVSFILDKIVPIKSLFSIIGENSLIIMIFHLLCFKPVSALLALTKGWPLQTIAGFPISYSGGYWWILYSLISISLCMLIAFIWKQIKQRLQICDKKVR